MSEHLKAALAELDCIGAGIANDWGPLALGEFVLARYAAIRAKLDKHQDEFKVSATGDWRDVAADALRDNRIGDAVALICEHASAFVQYIIALETLAGEVRVLASWPNDGLSGPRMREMVQRLRDALHVVKEIAHD